jgi:hypothetical protein
MSALPVGIPNINATVLRIAKPNSASRPATNSSAELTPAKVRGTITDTGGRLEGVGEGMLALAVDVAEALPLGLSVGARVTFAEREWDTVASTDTLRVDVARSVARAVTERDIVGAAEGVSAEGVARALSQAELLTLGEADAEGDSRVLPLPLAVPLADRESHDAEAEREVRPLPEKEGDAELEEDALPLREPEPELEGDNEGDREPLTEPEAHDEEVSDAIGVFVRVIVLRAEKDGDTDAQWEALGEPLPLPLPLSLPLPLVLPLELTEAEGDWQGEGL